MDSSARRYKVPTDQGDNMKSLFKNDDVIPPYHIGILDFFIKPQLFICILFTDDGDTILALKKIANV